ncbi:uncharacterized protein LOC132706516 [Cylas formicarius]|uniref:uncharacterized protein LOC132706516 n=1 Tax=Cylas formicarius TaxID=197179 RepID=UPI0029587920|nr:uncharacterized protein LOC132706516 [Cylas formicarius]
MCPDENLENSLRNVTYNADSTWTTAVNQYQKANMKLYQEECHVRLRMLVPCKNPATVKDRIPCSKLARYGNYKYNPARELSYPPAAIDFETMRNKFRKNLTKEPWMLEEVEYLMFAFLLNTECPCEQCRADGLGSNMSGTKNTCRIKYKPSYFEAHSLEEIYLIQKITSSEMKNIWVRENILCSESNLKTDEIIATMRENLIKVYHRTSSSQTEAIADLKTVSRTLQQQIAKVNVPGLEAETVGNKKLYSAILQSGNTTNKYQKQNSIISKCDLTKNTSCSNQTDFKMIPYNNLACRHSNFSTHHEQLRPGSNHFFPNFTKSNWSLKNQSYAFAKSTRTRPDLTQPSIRVTAPQLIIPNANFVVVHGTPTLQRTARPKYQIKRFAQNTDTIRDAPLLAKQDDATNNETDSLVIGTLNDIFEDSYPRVALTVTRTEELELQALEQYATSNEIFQELERQAIEQYEDDKNVTECQNDNSTGNNA